jgi:hypothetical protein
VLQHACGERDVDEDEDSGALLLSGLEAGAGLGWGWLDALETRQERVTLRGFEAAFGR